jgi:hypothetical protein
MTDLATLGVQFVSDSVETTNKRLDDFVGKSGAAQKATDALAAGQGRATSALMQQLAAIERLLSDLLKVTQAQTQAAGAASTFSRAQTEAAAAAQKAAQAQRQAADAALAQTKALEQSAQASRAASAAWTAQAQATAVSAAAQAKHITTSAQMAAAFEAVTLAGGANLVSMQALYGAAGRTEKSLHGLSGSVGLNTMQLQELGHVVRSSAGTIMAGGDAFQALGFEASRLASILTIGPNGVGGTITALIGLFVRFLPIIAAVAAAVGAAIAAFTLFRKATEDAVAQEKQFLAAQGEVANAMADTARYAHDAVAPINQMADAHDRAAAAARRQAMEELRLAEGQAQTALDKAKKDAEANRNRASAPDRRGGGHGRRSRLRRARRDHRRCDRDGHGEARQHRRGEAGPVQPRPDPAPDHRYPRPPLGRLHQPARRNLRPGHLRDQDRRPAKEDRGPESRLG